ncbi:TPA: MucR family transcriptional regulator [Enterobacter cloacae]
MATEGDTREKVVCRECGREFIFLAPHLRVAHGMTANEYRERWGIPKSVALASAEHSQNCRESISRRIRRGELVPADSLPVRAVNPHIRREARRRLKARNKSGETVRSIAEDLQLSVSCLYRWLDGDKKR